MFKETKETKETMFCPLPKVKPSTWSVKSFTGEHREIPIVPSARTWASCKGPHGAKAIYQKSYAFPFCLTHDIWFVSPQFIHSIIFAKAEYGWNCPCLVVTSTANFLALLSISWPARTARLSAKAVRAGLTPSLVWKAELSIQSLHSTGCTENALFQALKVLKLVWSYSSVETILCLCWGPISSG